MALAPLELLGEALRALLARQVEVADADSLRFECVDAAVERLHVLRLEMVVDEQHVGEALAGERGDDVHDHRLQRLLAHVDRPGEAGRVARHRVGQRRQDQHVHLGVVCKPRRDALAGADRDDRIGRERRVRAVRLGRPDRPEQHGRARRIEDLL
jgi:hypothetical protein